MKTTSHARQKFRALWLWVCLALVGAAYGIILSGFFEHAHELLD